MRTRSRTLLAAALGLALAGPAAAEIYRWTDAQGHVHFTQDLSRVPASARPAAEASARKETARSASRAGASRNAAPPARLGRPLQIPFEKQGNAMIVYARINDRVTAPFVVDTGASDVLVPDHVAQAAGVSIGRDTPQAVYQTANGLVEKPIVTLEAVQVGEVRVEQVRGSVSSGMPIGLLGGTFFNNFTFQIDPAANLITLFPNARVRAGANEGEWRARFQESRERLAALDDYLAGGELLDRARAASLAARREALAQELAALDDEANRAGVPQTWRE